jgi:hypothetical protein
VRGADNGTSVVGRCSLEGLDHSREGSTPGSSWGPKLSDARRCLLDPGGLPEPNEPVNVIRHDHELVQCYMRKTLRQPIPLRLYHEPQFREARFRAENRSEYASNPRSRHWLRPEPAPVSADRDEVASGLSIIPSRVPPRTAHIACIAARRFRIVTAEMRVGAFLRGWRDRPRSWGGAKARLLRKRRGKGQPSS